MLWTILVILLVLWLIGLLSHVGGGLIHLLLVVAVVMLGTLVGSLMPLAIRRLGLDPAVSSTPFVARLVDVFGLVVYFSLARFILSLA